MRSNCPWMTGHMYLFHNTIWNADDQGCGGIGGWSRWIKHCVTRNNVLHVRSDAGRSMYARNADFLLDRADLTMTVLEQGECVPPEVLCGSDCIDITSDPEHCGSCDLSCNPGKVCLDSVCRPGVDTTDGGTGDGCPGDADGTNHSSDPSQGCGCASGSPNRRGAGVLFFVLLALVAISRRRHP